MTHYTITYFEQASNFNNFKADKESTGYRTVQCLRVTERT